MRVVCLIIIGYLIMVIIIINLTKKNKLLQVKNEKASNQISKFQEYYQLMDQWMMNQEQGLTTANYFEKNGYKTIAIYGMGILGKHLYMELVKSNINVLYAIDQKGDSEFPNLHIHKLEDNLDEVDAVIITVTVSYGEIASKLEKKLNCSMISLEEVICES